MPIEKRAAQFAPFAALTGYEDVVKETIRKHEDEIDSCVMQMPSSSDAT